MRCAPVLKMRCTSLVRGGHRGGAAAAELESILACCPRNMVLVYAPLRPPDKCCRTLNHLRNAGPGASARAGVAMCQLHLGHPQRKRAAQAESQSGQHTLIAPNELGCRQPRRPLLSHSGQSRDSDVCAEAATVKGTLHSRLRIILE